MAKKKVHNLKTIEDMCRIVTEENYVRLVMDMADCIGFHIKLKRELTKKEYSELHRIFKKNGFVNLGVEKGYDAMHWEKAE